MTDNMKVLINDIKNIEDIPRKEFCENIKCHKCIFYDTKIFICSVVIIERLKNRIKEGIKYDTK